MTSLATIAKALAAGSGVTRISEVLAPYGPRGIRPDPGVWVASMRRVVLTERFEVDSQTTIAWRIANGTLYWCRETKR